MPKQTADTIVIQSFRSRNIPDWIKRCLTSVQDWARLHGHDYSLRGDEFFQLCGPEYLARNKSPIAITDLARLVATRQQLDSGYQRVIWLDADVFVFDPGNLVLNFSDKHLTSGYAFGREVWLHREKAKIYRTQPFAHNAAMIFTSREIDLDLLISLTRHIGSRRDIVDDLQVGVRLLRGLQYSLMFPTFSHVALFSPLLLHAIANEDEQILRAYSDIYRYQSFAANLTLSFQNETPESVIIRAMDHLEESTGAAINKYASDGAKLVPYETPEEGTVIELKRGGWNKFLAPFRRPRD
jgi:hypothetical protein